MHVVDGLEAQYPPSTTTIVNGTGRKAAHPFSFWNNYLDEYYLYLYRDGEINLMKRLVKATSEEWLNPRSIRPHFRALSKRVTSHHHNAHLHSHLAYQRKTSR
jgi:hypothetical protein